MAGSLHAGSRGDTDTKKVHPVTPLHVEIKKPDLVIERFWVEWIKPGEKIPTTGKVADRTYLYFNWLVRNIGDDHSKPTTLKIICNQPAQAPCPWKTKSFNVTSLLPDPTKNPNNLASGQVFYNKTPVPLSSSQRYQFIATIDPDNRVSEKNEGNNTLVSNFDSSASGIKILPLHLKTNQKKCHGYPEGNPKNYNYIYGKPGNDVIQGTPGNDVIFGYGGNDTIYGGGGNDIICGGDGNDTIYGGPGNDLLFGDNGENDRLYGGAGNDYLNGGKGHNDLCDGGSGNNTTADCRATVHLRTAPLKRHAR